MSLKISSIDRSVLAAMNFGKPHPDEWDSHRNFCNTAIACTSLVDLLSTYNILKFCKEFPHLPASRFGEKAMTFLENVKIFAKTTNTEALRTILEYT